MAISKLKTGEATGKILALFRGKKRAQEGQLWTNLKNMGGRDRTMWVEIWHDIRSSSEEDVMMCDNYRAVILL